MSHPLPKGDGEIVGVELWTRMSSWVREFMKKATQVAAMHQPIHIEGQRILSRADDRQTS